MDSIQSAAQRKAADFVRVKARKVDGRSLRYSKLTGQAYLDQYPLTPKQQAFVHGIANLGMSAHQAAMASGASATTARGLAHRYSKSPGVQYAIDIARRQFEKANMMTKKKVMDGFLEAIEMAKIKAEPMVMVAGWREVARMCGYFEPTRHKLEVTVQGEVVIQKLQQLDDHQLLQLADGDADALAGEFQVVEK